MSGWNWKRWPWTKPKRIELSAEHLPSLSHEHMDRLIDAAAGELKRKPRKPPTERERARASLMECIGIWFDGMSDEEWRELAVQLGEAFRQVKEDCTEDAA